MKSLKLFTVSCLVMLGFSTIFYACKKEVGPQGIQGETGVAGPAGSTVLSGNAAPGASTGIAGDFYLDLSMSKFYGPKKADGSWGNGFSMLGANGMTGPTGATGASGADGTDGKDGENGKDGKDGKDGVDGANGTNGNKILNGSGAPAANLGLANDYYLDKDSYTLYGPKLPAGWGIGVSLKGPVGNAGILYSGWQYAKAFSDTTVDNTKMRVGYITAKSLSNSILNSGTVMVYVTYGAGVFSLPYTSFAGGKLNTINFMPLLNRIVLTRFTADNSASISLSTLLQYRYVIIPGGTQVSNLRMKDLENYELMKKTFKVPD